MAKRFLLEGNIIADRVRLGRAMQKPPMKQEDLAREINLLGMAYNKHYPNEHFWEVAAEEGCKAILGLDAHTPKHILNLESEQRALQMVQRLGLELLETVELKQI